MNRAIKRGVDILGASFLLFLCAPLLVFIAILIKIDSNGPVFFKQIRMGKSFRPFNRVKFRILIQNQDKNFHGPGIEGTHSFSRVGKLLRQFKLDELPQLFNVVKGEMSLVGPRPELPYYVNKFQSEYQDILTIRPGLMDLAFLTYSDSVFFLKKPDNKSSHKEDVYVGETLPAKIKLAKVYLEHSSLWLDFAIMGQTVLNIFGLHSVLLKMNVSPPSERIGTLGNSTVFNIILKHRRIFVVVFDLGLIVAANYCAFWLRFDGNISEDAYQIFVGMLPWLLVVRGMFFMLFNLNEGLWRYVSIWDVKKILFGVTFGTVVFYGISVGFLEQRSYPRSIYILDSILLVGFLVGVRFVVRLYRERKVLNQMKRVLVIGAGDVGAKIVREMLTHQSCFYAPVGFVDDDPRKLSKRIHGVKVLGSRSDLHEIIREVAPEEVLLALPSSSPAVMREITSTLEPYRLLIKTLPKLEDILDGRVSINQIRPLVIEDLLQRPSVDLNAQAVSRFIEGKRVLVTGAGGSIGSELARQIINFNPKALILFERHENSLYAIGSELNDKWKSSLVHPVLGDITDGQRLEETINAYSPEIIFHAAAHKHVPLMELNPGEAIKNNMLGTKMVAEVATKFGVEHFVLISTDKAVNPSSIMGATKRGAELIIQAMAKGSGTCFLTVRFGNVLGSNGSVVPRFQNQIKAGGPITVTHPDVRRYFMSIPEAVGLVLQAATQGESGTLYMLDMGEQIKLVDLARNLIRLSGHLPEKDIAIEYVGLRPGEKLEEELVGIGEKAIPSSFAKIFKIQAISTLNNSFLEKVHEVFNQEYFHSQQSIIEKLQQIVPTFNPIDILRKNGSINQGNSEKGIVNIDNPDPNEQNLDVEDDHGIKETVWPGLEAKRW